MPFGAIEQPENYIFLKEENRYCIHDVYCALYRRSAYRDKTVGFKTETLDKMVYLLSIQQRKLPIEFCQKCLKDISSNPFYKNIYAQGQTKKAAEQDVPPAFKDEVLLNKKKIDDKLFMEYLENSVYYPACDFDGTPIKCLGKLFTNFVYVDYLSEYEDLEHNIKYYGLLGYRVINSSLIDAEELFGLNWENFMLKNNEIYKKLTFKCEEPFAKIYTFERASYLSDNHGKKEINLLFIKAEGISTYKYLYTQNNIAPKCLVSIVPGLAFGGNFNDYPKILIELIKSKNKFPQYQFYDDNCAEDFKDLIKYYNEVAQYNSKTERYVWSTHFTLADLDMKKL